MAKKKKKITTTEEQDDRNWFCQNRVRPSGEQVIVYIILSYKGVLTLFESLDGDLWSRSFSQTRDIASLRTLAYLFFHLVTNPKSWDYLYTSRNRTNTRRHLYIIAIKYRSRNPAFTCKLWHKLNWVELQSVNHWSVGCPKPHRKLVPDSRLTNWLISWLVWLFNPFFMPVAWFSITTSNAFVCIFFCLIFDICRTLNTRE